MLLAAVIDDYEKRSVRVLDIVLFDRSLADRLPDLMPPDRQLRLQPPEIAFVELISVLYVSGQIQGE